MTTPYHELVDRVRATLGDCPVDPAGRVAFSARADLATFAVLHAEQGDWGRALELFTELADRQASGWAEVLALCRRQALGLAFVSDPGRPTPGRTARWRRGLRAPCPGARTPLGEGAPRAPSPQGH